MKISCVLLWLSLVVLVTGQRLLPAYLPVQVPQKPSACCQRWIPPSIWTLNLVATASEGYCPYRVLRPGKINNCILDEPFTFVDCINKFCDKCHDCKVKPKCCSGCFITRWVRCQGGGGVWVTAPQSCTCED